jgi:diguanylate cyclase (GGDEF)-like protein
MTVFEHWRVAARAARKVVRTLPKRWLISEELSGLACLHPLTQLPNRSLCLEALDAAVASINRYSRQGALLWIDLDNFRRTNDALGYERGDEVLKQVAQRLSACVRADDVVGHLGSDEFAIVLREIASPDDAATVAEKVLLALASPIHVGRLQVQLEASIGIAVARANEAEAEGLFQAADTAMCEAKQRGGNQTHFFDPSLQTAAVARARTESLLRQAVERQQLVLHYQPQIDGVTRQCIGYEALLRWQLPALGLLYPDAFMEVAESSGLIRPIGHWVFEQACRDARWLLDTHALDRNAKMAVNVSMRQLTDPSLVDSVRNALDAADLAPENLEIEITETCVMEDADTTVATLRELSALNISLALDDFGTGFSSLMHLKKLPINALKIDRTFVDGLGHDHDDEMIVRTTLALAESMGLKVIAEGVETEQQAEFLLRHGCGHMQGFLYARPSALPRSHSIESMAAGRR